MLLVILGAVFLGRWSERELVGSPEAVDVDNTEFVAVATMKTFGRSIPLAVSVTWQSDREFVGQVADGVITAKLFEMPTEAIAGDILLWVDGRPVALAIADNPFYRDLSEGDSGDDVAALQGVLHELGYYRSGIDGLFGRATGRAVENYFDTFGIGGQTSAPLGMFLAVPDLGEHLIQLVLDDRVGERTRGSASVVFVDQRNPTLTATVALLPEISPGVEAVVDGVGVPLEIVAAERSGVDVVVTLGAQSSAADLCVPDTCSLRVTRDLNLVVSGELTVVPSTVALAVPSAAVSVGPSGASYVVDADTGLEVPVEVGAHQDGFALIVSGLRDGQSVLIQ